MFPVPAGRFLVVVGPLVLLALLEMPASCRALWAREPSSPSTVDIDRSTSSPSSGSSEASSVPSWSLFPSSVSKQDRN